MLELWKSQRIVQEGGHAKKLAATIGFMISKVWYTERLCFLYVMYDIYCEVDGEKVIQENRDVLLKVIADEGENSSTAPIPVWWENRERI